MKNQTQLSELDATKLANLRLRQELLNQETQALFAGLLATYGNPNEALSVGPDGRSLIRTPAPAPPKSRKR